MTIQIKSYLSFNELIIPTKKTKTYNVISGSATLGQIKWFSPWRRYCFFPYEGTLFDPNCLEEIKVKLQMLMVERKTSESSPSTSL